MVFGGFDSFTADRKAVFGNRRNWYRFEFLMNRRYLALVTGVVNVG